MYGTEIAWVSSSLKRLHESLSALSLLITCSYFFFLPILLEALSLQEGGFFQVSTLFEPSISAMVVVLHVPNEGDAPEHTSVSVASLFWFFVF